MAAKKRTTKSIARRRPVRRTSVPRESPAAEPTPQTEDLEIFEVHRRFIQVMEGDRLLTISAETRGHYLTVMRSLTAKLAVPGKPLSEILSEIMSEAAPLIFRVMQH
ncbi:MAG TPA: hypothetical protein VMV15_09925 [Candidatus Binataceae bacterium]|nr:hypothetical protein [Candidatus Binataceae bacterium]